VRLGETVMVGEGDASDGLIVDGTGVGRAEPCPAGVDAGEVQAASRAIATTATPTDRFRLGIATPVERRPDGRPPHRIDTATAETVAQPG
jgi:hypothetical protein